MVVLYALVRKCSLPFSFFGGMGIVLGPPACLQLWPSNIFEFYPYKGTNLMWPFIAIEPPNKGTIPPNTDLYIFTPIRDFYIFLISG